MSDGNQLLCEKHNDPDVLCRGCFNQLKAELSKYRGMSEKCCLAEESTCAQKQFFVANIAQLKAKLEECKKIAEQAPSDCQGPEAWQCASYIASSIRELIDKKEGV